MLEEKETKTKGASGNKGRKGTKKEIQRGVERIKWAVDLRLVNTERNEQRGDKILAVKCLPGLLELTQVPVSQRAE